ncbi:uncharacterized protein LOC112501856 [Cynara cardunculus var. scolymus]|uniref:uncharacterized protein LOC112501856 n=1 Tax=Cynara cardunculus var. scolymus TaxID=59895 RepID=UPI000D6310D2|nr:uncharacterized protein LOC112501856 [Cynara cardunculus var. scolymus]
MSFGVKWRAWIKGCLRTTSVAVLINGSPTHEFPLGRGVRQGDPLAPLLFILAAEALNIMMLEASRKGIFKGIKLPNSGPEISILQFADDVLIMGEWTRTNATNLIRLLRCFQLSSGLKVNMQKSNIMGVGADYEEVVSVASRLHCRPGLFPFTYLAWKSKILSYGGRLVLIKSVLGSLGLHYLSLLKAPTSIINKLESIRSRFFWGDKGGVRKISWISWSTTLADKDAGGLGISSLRALNLALLARWWWRFKLEHNHIWRLVIIALHGDDGGMNNLVRNGRFPGLWRNILKIHKEYNSFNLPFADWFQRDQSSNGINISWRWALTSHGNFSVSSIRAAYDANSLLQVSFRNSWWVTRVPSKINILAWRLLHKRLPTKINLAKRGVVCLSSLCPLCDCVEEDEEHLFIGCSISRQLLKDLCKWWKVDIGQVNSIDNLLDRSAEVAGNFSCKKAFIGVMYGFFWIIWNLRNRKTFSVPSQTTATFFAGQLQAYSFFWFKNRVPKVVMATSWIEWCNSPMSCF